MPKSWPPATSSPLPRSARLLFRRWDTSDLALASALWQSSEVMRFLGGPWTAEAVAERIDREMANDAAYGIQYWPIFLADGGAFVGCCGLKPHDPAQGWFEIGFHLLPQFWGAGLGTEAASAVISWAFEDLGASALFAGHHPQNGASRALLTRLGFTCIGTHFFAPTALQHPWYRRDRQPSPL